MVGQFLQPYTGQAVSGRAGFDVADWWSRRASAKLMNNIK
jgi:hypothetical protein